MSTISVRRRLLRWWLEIHAGLHTHLLRTVEEFVCWKPVPQEHIHALVHRCIYDHWCSTKIGSIMSPVPAWRCLTGVDTSSYGPIEEWDTSRIHDMSYLFDFKAILFHTYNPDISKWDVSNVTTMRYMLHGMVYFNRDLSAWNTSNVTNMHNMFSHALYFNGSVSSWNTSNVTDMSHMFYNALHFNRSVSSWNTSNVLSMECMFRDAKHFNQPLAKWNTANVTTLKEMFAFAQNFNQDLSTWNTANVTCASGIFMICKMFNGDVSTWDMRNCANMDRMFDGAHMFNQPLNTWDVSNVESMNRMFASTRAFNQPLNEWNVCRVTEMCSMFQGSIAFNNSVDRWRLHERVDCNYMFAHAKTFNQPLDGWTITSCVQPHNMLFGAIAFNQSVQCLFPSLDTISCTGPNPFLRTFALQDGPHYDALEARKYPWMERVHCAYDRFVVAKFHRKYPRHAAVLRKLVEKTLPHDMPEMWGCQPRSRVEHGYLQQLCVEHGVELNPDSFSPQHRAQTHWLFSKLDAPTCPERYILCMVLGNIMREPSVAKIFSTNLHSMQTYSTEMEVVFDDSTYDQLYRAATTDTSRVD